MVDNHITDAKAVEVDANTGDSSVEMECDIDDLQLALDTLSEEHRSILLLVCVEGYSYREVSSILELPVGTVTSRLARARSRIVEIMDSLTEHVLD